MQLCTAPHHLVSTGTTRTAPAQLHHLLVPHSSLTMRVRRFCAQLGRPTPHTPCDSVQPRHSSRRAARARDSVRRPCPRTATFTYTPHIGSYLVLTSSATRAAVPQRVGYKSASIRPFTDKPYSSPNEQFWTMRSFPCAFGTTERGEEMNGEPRIASTRARE